MTLYPGYYLRRQVSLGRQGVQGPGGYPPPGCDWFAAAGMRPRWLG